MGLLSVTSWLWKPIDFGWIASGVIHFWLWKIRVTWIKYGPTSIGCGDFLQRIFCITLVKWFSHVSTASHLNKSLTLISTGIGHHTWEMALVLSLYHFSFSRMEISSLFLIHNRAPIKQIIWSAVFTCQCSYKVSKLESALRWLKKPKSEVAMFCT